MIAKTLAQFFQDQLGDGYVVTEFRNALPDNAPSTEVMRVIKSTDEIIAELLQNKLIRAGLRTSQSDYIGLQDADGASFTWSLEFAAPTDYDIDADIEKIRTAFTDQTIPVVYNNAENYDLLLTFTMPAKFTTTTINGVDYQQVVWGGRGTLIQNSVVANGYAFYLGGERIPGVLSLSNGYTPQGENYTTERRMHQRTALQTFTNAVGLSIHATKNNAVIARMLNASMLGDTDGFTFEIQQNGVTVAQWEAALFNQVNAAGSLGSFVLIEVQILRS